MKKFELFIILFILYVYKNFIKEDQTGYTKFAKIWYFIPWLIRSTLIWIISPIFIPWFLFTRSKIYKESKKLLDDPNFQAQMMNTNKNFPFNF